MRVFVFLFFAVGLNAADIGSPIPFPRGEEPEVVRRAQISEASDRATPEKATGAKAKAATQGCELCGPKCCCLDCGCTATTWKDGCCAIPAGHKEAYIRYLQNQQTARSVPQANFPQGAGAYNSTTITPVIGADARYLRSPGGNRVGNMFTGARVEIPGSTSAGCATGG